MTSPVVWGDSSSLGLVFAGAAEASVKDEAIARPRSFPKFIGRDGGDLVGFSPEIGLVRNLETLRLDLMDPCCKP